jgi:hypothetical protein
MNLSLREWAQLDARAKAAREAVRALEQVVIDTGFRHRDDLEIRAHLLNNILTHVDDARAILGRIDCRPISEWVGGECWKWREPQQLYGGLSRRRYFSAAEVAEYEQYHNAG